MRWKLAALAAARMKISVVQLAESRRLGGCTPADSMKTELFA